MNEPRPAWTTTTLMMVATAWLVSTLLAGWFVVTLYRGSSSAKADAAEARSEVLELQRAAQCRATVTAAGQVALIDYVVAVSQGGDVAAALVTVNEARESARQVVESELCAR